MRVIKNWYRGRKVRHLEKMRELGKCPICSGSGYTIISSPYIGHTIDCHHCNATGLYSEWKKSNEASDF